MWFRSGCGLRGEGLAAFGRFEGFGSAPKLLTAPRAKFAIVRKLRPGIGIHRKVWFPQDLHINSRGFSCAVRAAWIIV